MALNEHYVIIVMGSGPGGAVNPALTIAANALRVADGIAARLKAWPAV